MNLKRGLRERLISSSTGPHLVFEYLHFTVCLPAGQFQHADMSVIAVEGHLDKGADRPNKEEGTTAGGILRWSSQQMAVTLQEKALKDSMQKRHQAKCWVVPKAEIERLLGHSYESYVVNHV